MKFSEIVRSKRNENGWDLRDLAYLSNIAISFISEIENEVSKPTMTTAVNLIYALGISLTEFIEMLGIDSNFSQFRERVPSDLRKSVLQIEDIEQFLAVYNRKDGLSVAKELLYDSYTFILQMQGQNSNYQAVKQVAAEAIYNATRQLNQQNVPLPYPTKLDLEILTDTFTYGGVIIFPDVGYYIRRKRIESEQSLMDMSQKLGVSHSSISRLERGEKDRIHLHEIIDIDRNLGLDGLLLGMCWAAAQFATGVQRNISLNLQDEPPKSWTPDEYAIASTIVKLDRLHQSVAGYFAKDFRANVDYLFNTTGDEDDKKG